MLRINELPEKGYIDRGSAVVFSRKERPCNNRKHWEASGPSLPSKASGNNGCLWLRNIGQEMEGCLEGGGQEKLISTT